MQLRISAEASRDIENIHIFGALEFGEAQADAYLDGLEQIFEYVTRFPEIARERSEVRPGIRIYPHRAHHVFYRLLDDAVLVVRVLHRTANWTATL